MTISATSGASPVSTSCNTTDFIFTSSRLFTTNGEMLITAFCKNYEDFLEASNWLHAAPTQARNEAVKNDGADWCMNCHDLEGGYLTIEYKGILLDTRTDTVSIPGASIVFIAS